jgi:hypothetical protein
VELYHSHAFQRLEVQISQSILDETGIDSTLSRHDCGRMQPELTMGRYSPPRIGWSGPSDAGGTRHGKRSSH